ncbi:hypothetical protein ACG02S_17330 [Roseateles sp. DC23W]|uniref:Lipoprotein n=1 Tax=Pelomonas dachongensis TaxID=3299029 RepID=A0ABW7ESQ9_9BURK
MKRTTLGVVLVAAAMLSGCIIVPPRHHGHRYGSAHVTVVESPRYERGDSGDRGGRDYGPPPRRGW